MSFKRLSNRLSKPDTAQKAGSGLAASTPKSGSNRSSVNGSERSLSIANGDGDSEVNYRRALYEYSQALPVAYTKALDNGTAVIDEQQNFERLQGLGSVREQSSQVFQLVTRGGEEGSLSYFNVDQSKLGPLVHSLVQVVKRDYPTDPGNTIPPHGRWQHLQAGGVPRLEELIKTNAASGIDIKESTRCLLDLTVVSVLLDAGAGNTWSFSTHGKTYRRSEGLAVASYEMFASGAFSSERGKFRVDAKGLREITPQILATYFQASDKNRMDGLEGRAGLLTRLADALEAHPEYFGASPARPGNMLDFIIKHEGTKPSRHLAKAAVDVRDQGGAKSVVYVNKTVDGYTVPIQILWEVLIKGLHSVWPEEGRLRLAGQSLGDVWEYKSANDSLPEPFHVPFHKLTQWMCYSLMIPLTRLVNLQFTGEELLTGLPEYRNGGLLIDSGLLTLKDDDLVRGQKSTLGLPDDKIPRGSVGPNASTLPTFNVSDPQIVEWRAVTIGFLDFLHKMVKKEVGEISLAQFLEAASWKTGREYAEYARPTTKSGPILIKSDGTVF